jgi:hypothetical protein
VWWDGSRNGQVLLAMYRKSRLGHCPSSSYPTAEPGTGTPTSRLPIHKHLLSMNRHICARDDSRWRETKVCTRVQPCRRHRACRFALSRARSLSRSLALLPTSTPPSDHHCDWQQPANVSRMPHHQHLSAGAITLVPMLPWPTSGLLGSWPSHERLKHTNQHLKQLRTRMKPSATQTLRCVRPCVSDNEPMLIKPTERVPSVQVQRHQRGASPSTKDPSSQTFGLGRSFFALRPSNASSSSGVSVAAANSPRPHDLHPRTHGHP